MIQSALDPVGIGTQDLITAVSIYLEEGEIYAHQFLSQSAVIGAKNELVETTHAIIPEHTRSKTL